MSVFKCKMCGGALEIQEDQTTAVCQYCGTRQTLPRLTDDARRNLYDRANHFRRNNEFDKAMGLYEQILNQDGTDAEAYWSLVLCRFGVEYVEDPQTHQRVPTVNRTQLTSIFDDENYKAALHYADAYQRALYEEEARAINEIQKGILAISQKAAPFDVFLCYKETDAAGQRTPDSVLAHDLYDALIGEGFQVFFARVTLETILGTAYEPYIFAALQSAKVMIVLGTRPEHFNAPWVKNEWSRYLALIQNGAKKTLIPAYRDMDPYDLPEEFSHLQAQDMGKLGFIQDLVRGVEKIIGADAPRAASGAAGSAAPLLKRAFMYLEDGNWERAAVYCERVLDSDPENAEGYLGSLMAELHCPTRASLQNLDRPFADFYNYQKAMRFGDDSLKQELQGYLQHITDRNEKVRLEGLYSQALESMAQANTEEAYRAAAVLFDNLASYRDAKEKSAQCLQQAEDAHKDAVAAQAEKLQKKNTVEALQQAIGLYESIPGWKDTAERMEECRRCLEELRIRQEQARLSAQQKEAQARRRSQKRKRIALILSPFVVAAIAFLTVLVTILLPRGHYHDGLAMMEAGRYHDAIVSFTKAGSYQDSQDQLLGAYYALGQALYAQGDYAGAIDALAQAGSYQDSQDRLLAAYYARGQALFSQKEYAGAVEAFAQARGYRDADEQCLAVYYAQGIDALEQGDYLSALSSFAKAGDHQNAATIVSTLSESVTGRKTTLSAGYSHTVALKSDGSAVAVGKQSEGACDVSGWSDLAAVSAGTHHTLGLRADGTAVATGSNSHGQCDVSGWSDLIAISAGSYHSIGLKSDGTVIAAGDNKFGQCNVSDWSNIIAISTAEHHTVGLRTDGTVLAAGTNIGGECDVSGWSDIIAVSAGDVHTVGLKVDGTVVAAGNNKLGQCNVSGWSNIIAVSAGAHHTVGLQADGTVVAVGDNQSGQCNVSAWTDIVAVSAGPYHTIGLKSDGTIVAAGSNHNHKCDVSQWAGLKIPATILTP